MSTSDRGFTYFQHRDTEGSEMAEGSERFEEA
jgi:hypothetical protein